MVTTNAGNGNSNENRPRNTRTVDGEKKEKRIYTTDNRGSDRGSDRPRGNFKRDGQSRGNGEFKPRNNNGEYKPRTNNGEYKPKSNNGGGYSSQRSYNNGGYSNNGFGGKGFDKDKDEETPVRRSKPKTDSKPREQQPDKFEIISRIEKEKKAMKKKHTESRNDQKPAKHTARPKRSGNIDWTREYENDSYDDDDLDMYL